MKQLAKYSNIPGPKSLKHVAKDYEKTYLDGSFQRYGGIERGSGWSTKFAQEFLGSLLENATSNSIIRADVKYCHMHAEVIVQQKDTLVNRDNLKYWQKIKEYGYDYVSIDGNNSSSSIYGFVNGEITAIQEGNEINLSDYEVGSERYDEILNEEKMEVNTLREITYLQMCRLFRKINRSTSLNDQEYRNAHPSELSSFIRELANLDRDVWKIVISDNALFDKRTHEHYLAIHLKKVKSEYKSDCNKKPLDEMYEKDNRMSSEVKKRLQSSVELFGKISRTHDGRKLSKSKVQAMLDLCDHTIQQGRYVVKNHKRFLAWFLAADAHFLAESTKIPMDDNQYVTAYQCFIAKFTAAPNYRRINLLFREAFVADIESLKSDGAIADAPNIRNSSGSFTQDDALALWSLQDAKDRNGNDINILDIYLGKYEVDHVRSVKSGGKTVIKNAELMTVSDNRSKGSKSNIPVFEHQLMEE